MLRLYYWPGMVSEVKRQVEKCQICQECKKSYQQRIGYMVGKELPNQRIAKWSMDLMGDYHRTNHGNKYILVMVELATRFCVIVPLKDKKGTHVANAIREHLIGVFGPPETILSDNGSEFKNSTVAELLESYGTRQQFISRHHPQANVTERRNRDIKSQLRVIRKERGCQWDDYLPLITLRLNMLQNRSLGCTPYFLMFGTEGHMAHHLWHMRLRGESAT